MAVREEENIKRFTRLSMMYRYNIPCTTIAVKRVTWMRYCRPARWIYRNYYSTVCIRGRSCRMVANCVHYVIIHYNNILYTRRYDISLLVLYILRIGANWILGRNSYDQTIVVIILRIVWKFGFLQYMYTDWCILLYRIGAPYTSYTKVYNVKRRRLWLLRAEFIALYP